jgi:hypothetical protein
MKKLASILLASLLLTACGGDKSLDEHQKEKAAQEATRLATVAGTYRGSITSQRTGQAIGGFEIELNVARVPNDSGDTTNSKSRLEGRVTVYASQQSSAIIELAEFASDGNSGDGTFSGRITVPLRGTSVQLSLNGAIRGAAFTGTLSPTSRPGTPASFSLTRNGALGDGGQNSIDPNPSRAQDFTGSFQDPNCAPRRDRPCRSGETVPVRLRLDRGAQSVDEAFLNHFLDSQFVGLQLTFDETTTLALPGAELNERAGTIRFQGIVQGSISTQATFNCTRLGQGWRCQYAIGSFGISYNFDLSPGGR